MIMKNRFNFNYFEFILFIIYFLFGLLLIILEIWYKQTDCFIIYGVIIDILSIYGIYSYLKK